MTHTRPMSCAPRPDTVGPKHRPVEDGYRITPAQELDLAVDALKWAMVGGLPTFQRRWLREVLRAIKSAQAGLGS